MLCGGIWLVMCVVVFWCLVCVGWNRNCDRLMCLWIDVCVVRFWVGWYWLGNLLVWMFWLLVLLCVLVMWYYWLLVVDNGNVLLLCRSWRVVWDNCSFWIYLVVWWLVFVWWFVCLCFRWVGCNRFVLLVWLFDNWLFLVVLVL